MTTGQSVEVEFRSEIWFWRGPSPYHFMTVPDRAAAGLAAVAPTVSYGWGMTPVAASIGGTAWTTPIRLVVALP